MQERPEAIFSKTALTRSSLTLLISPFSQMLEGQKAYLDNAEEFTEVNKSVSVLIENPKQMLSLKFRNLEAIVYKSPAEIVNVHRLVAILVQSTENLCNLADSVVRLLENLGLNLGNQVGGAYLLQLLNRLVKFGTGGSLNHPVVLLLLVAARHISGDGALLFEIQVLGLVDGVVAVSADFKLSAKVILVGLFIGGQILSSLAMAEHNAFTCLYGLTLTFETEVRVHTVNNPDVVERALGVHAALLVVTKCSVSRGSVGH
jgi:hypothetical protein